MEPLIPAALRLVWKVFWRLETSMAGISYLPRRALRSTKVFGLFTKDIVAEQVAFFDFSSVMIRVIYSLLAGDGGLSKLRTFALNSTKGYSYAFTREEGCYSGCGRGGRFGILCASDAFTGRGRAGAHRCARPQAYPRQARIGDHAGYQDRLIERRGSLCADHPGRLGS